MLRPGHYSIVRSDLPSGTVTFLFTDVEGSTKLLHELGAEAYGEALGEHRRLLRDAFSVHGGVEVDTQGDAFFVAFPTAPGALQAASLGVDDLAKTPIRVRVGIHTGTPHLTEEGYVGVDVHRAARIAAAGHGGQILLSGATAALIDGAALRDLGPHRLKDLSAPEQIFQLGDNDFPPLKTLYRTNLPVVGGAFVGRDSEIEETRALLRSHRLVTLTGAGGSGKTRLAIHLAAAAAEEFPDGVFWVPLQAVRDPRIVEHTIAAAVGADDSLVRFVGGKRMLVLLDNFEHVIEAAPTVGSLLAGTAYAKVLATSREPLQVAEEQCYAVEPLRVDEAVRLFEERACAVVRSFQLTADVAAICERLDRLPLAIELAATRVVLLDTRELLVRLDQRLPLLTSRSRDAPERQKTLRATIDWSYELLSPDEQTVFRRLSVFRGAFALGAAATICGAELDTLESLVVKNLLRRRWETDRLLLLDTIREYAAERLAGSDEGTEIHRRHLEYFLEVAHAANLNAGDLAPGGQHLELANADQDDLRGALAWAIRNDERESALRLATALEQFWVTNDPSEGARWFERILSSAGVDAITPEARAHGLRAWGSSAHIAGDARGAERLCRASLALFEQLGDDHGRAVLLHRLAIYAMLAGDTQRARELVLRSHELHAQSVEPARRAWGHAQTTAVHGALARDAGDDATAREQLTASAELAERAGVQWWQGGMLAELAALSLLSLIHI